MEPIDGFGSLSGNEVIGIFPVSRASYPRPAEEPNRHHAHGSCASCSQSSQCLPKPLKTPEIERLEGIIRRGRPLRKGTQIYQQGQPFRAVYAVRSGALKTFRNTDGGREIVTGFYFPGEIIGLDGLAKSQYLSSATTLETSSICETSLDRLNDLGVHIPNLQRHLLNLMSREIVQYQQMITSLCNHKSEQRVAAFLLNIVDRNTEHHLSASAFRLPMSRTDIGNYLGLSVETVSRSFTDLQKRGLIEFAGRDIKLLKLNQLRALVDDVYGLA
jgi:CRP/FNR family transcriptional regulator